jgi:radical SAM-linked protein
LRVRLALRYAVDGDLRFLSHHDSLRLFERVFVRAGLPVRYSEGFNPRPRLSIVLPRPVGVASQDELVVVQLTTEVDPADAMSRLSRQVPDGLTVLAAELITADDKRIPREARYELELDPILTAAVTERAAELLSKDRLDIARTSPKADAAKTVDIRQYLASMAVADGRLRWAQAITLTGTARPQEILEALDLPSREHLHRLRRVRVEYLP